MQKRDVKSPRDSQTHVAVPRYIWSLNAYTLGRRWQTFPVKGQIVNILDFTVLRGSATIIQPHCCSM